MKHLDKVILDADICLKLGRYEKVRVLEKIIPQLSNQTYIHEYVLYEELLTPRIVKEQLIKLSEAGYLNIVSVNQLNPFDKQMYESTIRLLSKVMKGTEDLSDSKHRGEIVSLSIAKTLDIPIFMSDEAHLQPIINSQLNSGIENNISVFRLIDLIMWIKENPDCGIARKEAKFLWCGAYDKEFLEYYKGKFDQEIWIM